MNARCACGCYVIKNALDPSPICDDCRMFGSPSPRPAPFRENLCPDATLAPHEGAAFYALMTLNFGQSFAPWRIEEGAVRLTS